VPHVLADEQRGAPPRRVERPHLEAALHEALLVEQAVRGEEVLAVHVADGVPVVGAERSVERRVVQRVAPHLVETDHHVERPRRQAALGARRAVGAVEVARRAPRRHGELAHAPLDEVARGGRLGQEHGIGARVERGALGEQGAEARDVRGVRALDRLELDDGDGERLGHGRKMTGPGAGRPALGARTGGPGRV
jgi:hypothetical protein